MFNKRMRVGFTIIELMLAMTFVSFLLVAIAMLTIQMSNLYTKGVTMKEINQVGTEVADDMRATIAGAYVKDVRFAERGDKLVLCAGNFSYIANNATKIQNNSSDTVKLGGGQVVRLAKVRDVNGALCSLSTPLPPTLSADAVELIGGGDRNLVVRRIALLPSNSGAVPPSLQEDFDAGRMIYTIKLTLSTGIDSELDLTNDECKPPSDNDAGREFCAIDTFTIVARVGNTFKK